MLGIRRARVHWGRGTATAVVSISMLTAVSLVVCDLSPAAAVETSPAALAPTNPKAAKPASLTAPDGVAARVNAALSGHMIEDLSQRTESSSTYAMPDGSWQTAMSPGVVWVKRGGDGTSEEDWTPADATLKASGDGLLRPAAMPGEVAVSGKQEAGPDGVSTLATVTDPDTGVKGELTWRGDLPTPEVAGPRATYREVKPGVDMVVEANGSGLEQYFVLREKPSDPEALELELSLAADKTQVRKDADGAVEFKQGKDEVFRIDPATMWDATHDSQLANPVTQPWQADEQPELWSPQLEKLEDSGGEGDSGEQPAAAGEGEVADVPTDVKVGNGTAELDLSPDASFLNDPDVTYPVVIDPSVNLGIGFDTYVQSGVNSDKSGAADLRLGSWNGGTNVARSYLNVNTGAIRGKVVASAQLKLWQFHSYSCQARAWDIWSADLASTSSKWTAQPKRIKKYATSKSTKGFSSGCKAGWSAVDITSMAKAWAGASGSKAGVALLASNEKDSYSWKKFNSANASSGKPTVVVSYNTYPNTPSRGAVGAGQYSWFPNATDPNRTLYVKTLRPTISAAVSDPDGGKVQGLFSMIRSDGAVTWNKVKGTSVASGAVSSVANVATALSDNSRYTAEVWGFDGKLTSKAAARWTMVTDASPPPTPTITASEYQPGQWREALPAANTFSFQSAAGDVWQFEYSRDGGPWTRVASAGNPGRAQLNWNPGNGAHELRVRALDRATNASGIASFKFGAGTASLTSPIAGLKSTDIFEVTGSAPPAAAGTVTPSVHWRLAGTSEPVDYDPVRGSATGWTKAKTLPAIGVGADVKVTTAWSAVAAAESLKKSRVPVLLDVQLCFTYSSPAMTRCTWNKDQDFRSTVVRVPHAFGDDYPTAEAGPGQVALWTGEYNQVVTDVSVPGYVGDLTVSRSYSSLAGVESSSVFGPGWKASFDGSEGGVAEYEVVDSTDIDGTIALIDEEGMPLIYRQPGFTRVAAKPGVYEPVDDETVDLGARLELKGAGNEATLTLTEDDGTVTLFKPATQAGKRAWLVESVTDPGQSGTTSFTRDTSGRVTRILAPVPPGVTCPASGPLAPGCRAIHVHYGASGAGSGKVSDIVYEAFDPDKSGGAGMSVTTVATYEYNDAGYLTKVTDPRLGLSTAFAYDGKSSSGQPLLTGMTPPGLAGFTLGYGKGSQDDKSLLTVDRANPQGVGEPTRLARFVYGIDPTKTHAGLPNMTGTDVSVWGQQAAPAYGAAVFASDRQNVAGSSPDQVSEEDWPYADLQYTDAEGRVVNSAAYGAGDWQISATRYDAEGRKIHALDAKAVRQIRDLAAAQEEPVAAEVIDSYASITRYNADIKLEEDATGPDGTTVKAGTVIAPAGTRVTDAWEPARETPDGLQRVHVHTDYDQGAPNHGVNPVTGLAYSLTTTTTTTAADALTGSSDPSVPLATDEVQVSQSKSGYDAIDGKPYTDPSSGWSLGSPTRSTNVMGEGKDDIVSLTRFDGQGRIVETRGPGSNGSDAGTSLTGFYTTEAQSGRFAACGGKPQWAGLTCMTTTGEERPSLPVETVEKYTYYLASATTVEKSGEVTRTNESTFDAAGRQLTSAVTTTGLKDSTPVPVTTTTYDPATGMANGTVATENGKESGRISQAFDKWGRQVSYTNSQGETTTTQYNAAGQVASEKDPLRTTTYGYDTAKEHRGLTTRVEVSGVGAFTATYDGTGAMVEQSMPGGVRQLVEHDRAGEMTAMSYVADGAPGAEPTPLLSWDIESNIEGDSTSIRSQAPAGPDAAGFDREQTFRYDRAGRLTDTTDTIGGQCSTRSYGFDQKGNRLSKKAASYETGSGCEGEAVTRTNQAWEYDTADRVQHAGSGDKGKYHYDPLGRQVRLPAADSPAAHRQEAGPKPDSEEAPAAKPGDVALGYYDSDAIRTVAQDDSSTTYSLDVAGRRLTSITTRGEQQDQVERHYSDSGDNPAWATTSGKNDPATGQPAKPSTTWYGNSIGGDLGLQITDGAASLSLVDPLGSVATSVKVSTKDAPLQIGGVGAWDEFGNAIERPETDGALDYGWLGGQQRAGDPIGLILMGARLYNTITGLFTSVDPVDGGNSTAYTYPQDPINNNDISGLFSWNGAKKWWKKHGGTASKIVTFGATVGCMVPAVGWGLCAGLQAGAYALRTAHKVSNQGGWKKNRGSILADGIVTAATLGTVKVPLRYAQYNKAAGRVVTTKRGRSVQVKSTGRPFWNGKAVRDTRDKSWVALRSQRNPFRPSSYRRGATVRIAAWSTAGIGPRATISGGGNWRNRRR